MPSRFSCFDKLAKRLRKGTIVPRQGHLCAKVRALLCLREAQEMQKSDITRKSEAQISIFQRYESQTSHLYFLIMRNINAEPFTKSGSESNSPSLN